MGAKQWPYYASRRFVLRTPLLSARRLGGWGGEREDGSPQSRAELRESLRRLIEDPQVSEALFLASPSLWESLERWRAEPGHPRARALEVALVKYVSRMALRATPFGLFSGVSVGDIERHGRLELGPRTSIRRRTRLDNDFLFALCDVLSRDPQLRARLRYRPSTSLYGVADRLRYAEARLNGTERSYHLVSVELTAYLEATLARARDGARLEELAAGLVADDSEIEPAEARAYLDELVDAQLLVSDLGVTITGPEPLEALIVLLREAAHPLAAPLVRARAEMRAIDEAGVAAAPRRYRSIARSLTEVVPEGARPELGRLFQVDLVKPAASLALPRAVVREVEQAVAALARCSEHRDDVGLRRFRESFASRYEDREVPLTEALDEESGVGFEVASGPGSEGSPLLAGLPFGGSRKSASVELSASFGHLARRLADHAQPGQGPLVLDASDLAAMEASPQATLPEAFSVLARLEAADESAAQRGDFQVLVEGAAGPSGARLLGRFCHASADIEALVREHLAAEEALRPEAVFAELVHLSEGRIGNILCRPVLRSYELPYLGLSGAPRDRQLQLDDLMVSVRDSRVVLRSRSLGQEVVPRLSTAHNYRLRSLSMYRFLCALQGQQGGGVGWNWGPLAQLPYLPRVRLGRAVLARARWLLGSEEIAAITEAVRKERRSRQAADFEAAQATLHERMQALRRQRALPRFVVLADGDNELPIDLDNELSTAALGHELAGRSAATLCELFPDPDAMAFEGPEGSYANELLIPFVRAERAVSPTIARPCARLPRRFLPGSSWLYAKLYCGNATADRVLCEAVGPVARAAVSAGDIERWFFLRYADPEPHVRVRFAGKPDKLAALLRALEQAVRPLAASGAIWRMQLDTYEREVERYGGDYGIELAEELFFCDSEAVLGILEHLDGDAGTDARWRLALPGAEALLNDLGFDESQRHAIYADARQSFGREFGVTAELGRHLGTRYRELEGLESLLRMAPDHPLALGFQPLAERSLRLIPIAAELRRRDQAGELQPTLARIAWSYVHMHCNRLLHASHRAHELVLYDFLNRHFAARRARQANG